MPLHEPFMPSLLPFTFVSNQVEVAEDPKLAVPSFDPDSYFGMMGPNSLYSVATVPLSDPASAVYDSQLLVKRPGGHVYSKTLPTRDSVGDPFVQLVTNTSLANAPYLTNQAIPRKMGQSPIMPSYPSDDQRPKRRISTQFFTSTFFAVTSPRPTPTPTTSPTASRSHIEIPVIRPQTSVTEAPQSSSGASAKPTRPRSRRLSKSASRLSPLSPPQIYSLFSINPPQPDPPPPPPPPAPPSRDDASSLRSQASATELLEFYASGASVAPTPPRSRRSSRSARSSPPPSFLHDDDPFASLSTSSSPVAVSPSGAHSNAAGNRSSLSEIGPSTAIPRSPLVLESPVVEKPSTSTSPVSPTTSHLISPQPGLTRKMSSGGNVRPAYQKPAFTPRPSLPSLRTLAQMNVIIPKKARKGTVGASLPYEPWDTDTDTDTSNGIAIALYEPHNVDIDAHVALDLDVDSPEEESSSDGDIFEYISHNDGEIETIPEERASALLEDAEEEIQYGVALSDEVIDFASTPSLSSSASEFSASPIIPPESVISASSSDFTPHPWDHSQSSSISSFTAVNNERKSSEDSMAYSSPKFGESPISATLQGSDQSLDLDWSSGRTSPLSELGFSPYISYYNNASPPEQMESTFEQGSSEGTIHCPTRDSRDSWASLHQSSADPEGWVDDTEPVDGTGWEDERGRGRGGYEDRQDGGDGYGRSGTNYNSSSNDGGLGGSNGLGGAGGGGRGDDGEDHNRRKGSSASVPSESGESTTEDEGSTDDYGADEAPGQGASPLPPQPQTPTTQRSRSSDDDVPLAQRIPTALKAQKSIRVQVREEREARRKDRAVRTREPVRSPPRGAEATGRESTTTGSQDAAALHSSRSVKREGPRRNSDQPFAVEDLTKKLLSVQAGNVPPAVIRPRGYSAPYTSPPRDPPTQAKEVGQKADPIQTSDATRERALRPMRSFHRPTPKNVDGVNSGPSPSNNGQILGRSVTSGRSRRHEENQGSQGERLRSTQSLAEGTERYMNIRSKSSERPMKDSGGRFSARTSTDADRGTSHRPPMPPLPAEVLASFKAGTKAQVSQQRIFIGDLQRFNIVEIGLATNAQDVLDMLDKEGALEPILGRGGWMVYEMAQDFGMERPIRGYELITDITSSWNQDKLVNMFMIKKSPLASILSRSAIPSSSPMHRGYVEWEVKRGKWSKRWMELREHSLWLSKRDTGKDEIFLCSLSNFDAYVITRRHKAPKPFAFALKSSDNISLFENKADYLHMFSCSQKDGDKWMEKILLARSYVLHQERTVLFARGDSSAGVPSPPGTSKALPRSGTRKHPNPQPLVNVSAPFTMTSPTSTTFEPGSLLAKRGDF